MTAEERVLVERSNPPKTDLTSENDPILKDGVCREIGIGYTSSSAVENVAPETRTKLLQNFAKRYGFRLAAGYRTLCVLYTGQMPLEWQCSDAVLGLSIYQG